MAQTKPSVFNGDLAHLPKALHWLTTKRRWVVWKWKQRADGSWTKPPYRPDNPRKAAKSNDATTWGSYEDAVAAVAANQADGIGVMLLEGELAAVDLDACRDPVSGVLTIWGERHRVEAIARGLYVEITVSGTGLRFIGLSHGDKLHRRFPIKQSTHEGIELYRKCERYITISGLQEGQCESMPEIDEYLDLLFQRYTIGNPQPATPTVLNLNTATPQASDYFQDVIENGAPEGERSEKFSEVVWHLASGGASIEEIVEELAKYPNGIGAKYAKRLLAEVTRCYDKWRSQRLATITGSGGTAGGVPASAGAGVGSPGGSGAGAATTAPAGRPWFQIKVIPSELPRMVKEAERALVAQAAYGDEIYQRGGKLVRPVTGTIVNHDGKSQGLLLIDVVQPYLVSALCRAAQFIVWDGRGKGKNKGKWKAIDAPDKVARVLLTDRGRWKVLPVLNGIVQTPFLRVDGSICETPGYDPASKLLFKTDVTFPPIPQYPSRNDALAAIELYEDLIKTFPFVGSASRSVALTAMYTSLDRCSMSTAPLHAFNSPVARTGKSKLVDLCAVLATGERMAVIGQGYSDDEFVKCLDAALLAGHRAISIDNCERPLKSDHLCRILTQTKVNLRTLGSSTLVEILMNSAMFATGNNLTFSGDVIYRALMCSMDANTEHPGLRPFESDVIAEAQARRVELVVAALTILRAWHIAGARPASPPPFGGFEDWSFRIREPLIWLGRADPCETCAEIQGSDPHRAELLAVIEQWKRLLVLDQGYTVQQIISQALVDTDFHNALLAVATSRSSAAVNGTRLGIWLNRIKGKIVGGLRVIQCGYAQGCQLWMLTPN